MILVYKHDFINTYPSDYFLMTLFNSINSNVFFRVFYPKLDSQTKLSLLNFNNIYILKFVEINSTIEIFKINQYSRSAH